MAKFSAAAYLRMRLISEYIWYISDLPHTIPRKYAYADDLTIMHADGAKAQHCKNGVGSLPP